MEEKILSVTYKNSYHDIYEANYSYAVLRGRLSKRYFLKIMIPGFLLCVLASVLTFFEEDFLFGNDYSFFIISFLISVLALVILYFTGRAFNKLQIKNFSRLLFDSFNAKSLRRADFYEDRVVIESGYSRVSIPYEEFDYVISDRLNFVFGFGGDMNIRNIPKTKQNPDMLFALDKLFSEKLGEKFIYKM